MNSELGLSLDGAVGVVRHAGVDAGVLLRQVGDVETGSSQNLDTTLAGNGDRNGVSVCPGKLPPCSLARWLQLLGPASA